MKNKIHLGKTGTSRTRKKLVKITHPLPATETTFTNYLLRKGFSTSSVKRFTSDTNLFLKWLQKENIAVENVVYNDITSYLQSFKNIVQHTKGCYLRSVKHYFNYCIQQEQRQDNPAAFIQLKGIKRKSLYDILNRQELDSLYQHFTLPEEDNVADKNKNWFKTKALAQQRNKAILGLMLYQGLDVRDLKLVQVNDVKLREGTVQIPGTRRSNERVLPLEALQIMDLMEYSIKTREALLQLHQRKTNQLFISIGTGDNFGNMMTYLMQRLRKINKKVTCINQLKTSVIVHWLKLYNLREVQYKAGHRYVSSTEQYLANEMEGMLEDIDKYHPIV
jgi:integrase/recombinase XerD